MSAIGRNESCPCGSGKKYKKCCGKAGVVDINQLIHQELDVLQAQAYDYIALHNHPKMEEAYHQYLNDLKMLKKDQEVYEMAFVSWYGVTHPLESGQTLLEQFIDKQMSLVTRPQTKEALESWSQVRLTAGKVEQTSPTDLVVTEAISGDVIEIHEEFSGLEENSFFVGILLPYKEKYVPFAQYFIYPQIEAVAGQVLREEFEDDQESTTLHDHLMKNYLWLADLGFFLYGVEKSQGMEEEEVGAKPEEEEFTWSDPAYPEALESLKEFLVEHGEEELSVEGAFLSLENYFLRERPKIRNPKIYSAAAIEAVKGDIPFSKNYLQKDLAEAFEVSANSISRRSKEMKKILY
ncbi:hypothetical protein JOC86_002456 [Bacillus pakistanensis]|uniref:SEC-C motif-containing protein n=1 Tax=Rossellomorea pakistanensis TaxID=992288 RepID=A0ABS2NDH8_9BACI|nr:SEC-C metal-binding domain-containing protein [Bacillus pakistanensis]MBM7585914.1 hypothetical protein [Bacillus pakistanensis]